jgi:hypothetical protein
MSEQRVTNLYDLSDSVYEAPPIHEQIRALRGVPIIAVNSRPDAELKVQSLAGAKRQKLLNLDYAEDVGYRGRTTVKRANARLKDQFGKTSLSRAQRSVRGNAKQMCHLMFGIVRLAADQILSLITEATWPLGS